MGFYPYIPLGTVSQSSKTQVLNLFFDIETEAVTDTGLEIIDDLANLPRAAATGVVDQIRMIVGDMDVTVLDAFCSHFLEEVCRRHLPVANHLGIDEGLHVLRQFGKQEVFEYASRALHRGRILRVA